MTMEAYIANVSRDWRAIKNKKRGARYLAKLETNREKSRLYSQKIWNERKQAGWEMPEEKVAARKAARRRYKEKNQDMLRMKERDRARAVRAAKKIRMQPIWQSQPDC